MKGDKKLLLISDVKFIEHVPNYRELSSKGIWSELKQDPAIAQYFPAYSKSRSPQKKYLLNIVNTLRPDSIKQIVEALRAKKEATKVENESIVLTGEFSQFFQQF